MKTSSLVTGIISLILGIASWFIFGIPFGVAGLVLGIYSVSTASKAKNYGENAVAGLVLGVIGLTISAIGLLILIVSLVIGLLAA